MSDGQWDPVTGPAAPQREELEPPQERTEAGEDRRARTTRWMVAAVAVSAVVSLLSQNRPEVRRASAMDRWAARARAHVPEVVNEDLEVTGVTGGPSGLSFRMTLRRARKAQIDLAAFQEAEEARVMVRACGGLRGVLEAGGYLRFAYVDRDGADVASLHVNPSACGLKDPSDTFMPLPRIWVPLPGRGPDDRPPRLP